MSRRARATRLGGPATPGTTGPALTWGLARIPAVRGSHAQVQGTLLLVWRPRERLMRFELAPGQVVKARAKAADYNAACAVIGAK